MPRKLKSKEMLKHYTKEELMQYIDKSFKLALALDLATTGKWHTYNREILKIKKSINGFIYLYKEKKFINQGDTVAHVLAMYNPIWITYDSEILKLENDSKVSVAQILAENKKICFYSNHILNKKIEEFLLIQKNYIASRVKKNIVTIIPII